MNPPENRIQMRDLAREAGVSISTVSRALRNDQRLSEKTRRKIQVLARQFNYRPDPGLSALAAYRSRVRPPSDYGKLAVLLDMDRPEERLSPLYRLHIGGVRTRARQLGYDVDVFLIKPEESEQKRLSRVLYSRGIRGVVVTPLRWLPSAMDWDRFSVVALGENMTRLGLNTVTYDHDESITVTYRKLRERGYKRIGFSNIVDSEFRNRHLYLGAYLKCLHLDGVSVDGSPVYLYDNKGEWSPVPWLDANGFDAVMSVLPDEFLWKLKGTRYKVPKNLGLAGYHLPKGAFDVTYTAFVGDPFREGSAAVDLLQSMMQNNQCGIPPRERHYAITVKGNWHEGTTIRKASRAAARTDQLSISAISSGASVISA